MSDMKIFDNAAFGSIRVHIDEAGNPWFVARDVCQVLEIQNPSDTVHKGLDEDEITAIEITDTSSNGVTQRRTVLTVSESGLYALIFRSRKPEAKAFSKWVRAEVLPSIRKTGQYKHDGYVLPRIPQSFSDALRMIADIEDEKQKAIEQRDYFKRTKAEIGSRREATAMNTASRLSKENAKLKDDAGIGKKWKAAKAIEWIEDVLVPSPGMWSQLGKKLSALSLEMGYEVRRLQTPEYPNGIGLYHVAVVDMLKSRIETHPEMLWRYRREEAA